MPEVPAPVVVKCDGCNRHFDSDKDLSRARVGVQELRYCRRCYLTGLGPDYKPTFEQSQELDALA